MIDILGLLGGSDISAHSSIILTYEIDLPLYDGLVRRRLKQAGVNNQMVFCDLRRYVAEMEALSATRFFGKAYSVTPVHQKAAFHPKLYLLLGRKKGCLLVGSGNTTIGGLLRNAEVFGRFDYDSEKDEGPHAAFRECTELVKEIAKDAPDVVRRQLEKALAWTPWLSRAPQDDGRILLVGGSGRKPLLDQALFALKDKRVNSVLVCSSSFDRDLQAVKRLTSLADVREVRCIVQPENVRLDGRAVRRLSDKVQWHAFVDPYPKEKRKRKDARAHAKLIVFDCGVTEVAVYGSANASRPALLEGEGNMEVVVMLPPSASGTTQKLLGLDSSLRSKNINTLLAEKQWADEQDDESGESYGYVLISAVPSEEGVIITVAGDTPNPTIFIELAESVGQPALARARLSLKAGKMIGSVDILPESVKVARLVDSKGHLLSNTVGLTWPEVANSKASSGVSAKAEAAIAAMQDGVVLGTVLFELLDHFRDFEVVLARPGGRSIRNKDDEIEDEEAEERSVESFYTDALPGESNIPNWKGDRLDLDILASLVQPLTTGSTKLTGDGEEDIDETVLSEEIERRVIDVKGGRATGEERVQTLFFPTRETLERAARRLERRLERAANSIEKALGTRTNLTTIPPASLARQIWMTHIGAFLAGRTTLSAENEEVLCLEPVYFADYVLRISRALAGGRDGGLLKLLPADAWSGPDGETLQRGLCFLWTCSVWAAACVVNYWNKEANDDELANGLWDAAPELIAARFILAIRQRSQDPDTKEIEKRLPAWEDFEPGWFRMWQKRINKLVELIESIETADKEPSQLENVNLFSCQPGTLVRNPMLGVTVFMGAAENQKYCLLDLSRSENFVRTFINNVFTIRFEGTVGKIAWRNLYPLPK